MTMVVQKYGGSSLADEQKIKAVANQVIARKNQGVGVVVVVSAMGKTTDSLLAQARAVSTTPSRRELDMLVTAGERISMSLLSMALHAQGAKAISFTGSQSGIVTEASHQGAQIVDVRPIRIQRALEQDHIVVVAGYQGVSVDKEVTTLGRGGSDTTAVALAAALGAQRCEIYSDIDGVYSADPRACSNARHLGEISYESMELMAYLGAKVLSHRAVGYAKKHQVVIRAGRTGQPEGRHTMISDNALAPVCVVAHEAITLDTDAPLYARLGERNFGDGREFAAQQCPWGMVSCVNIGDQPPSDAVLEPYEPIATWHEARHRSWFVRKDALGAATAALHDAVVRAP